MSCSVDTVVIVSFVAVYVEPNGRAHVARSLCYPMHFVNSGFGHFAVLLAMTCQDHCKK